MATPWNENATGIETQQRDKSKTQTNNQYGRERERVQKIESNK